MSAGQPAKPPCGAGFTGSPRCRARARPHCFSPAGSRLTCVRRSGFAPAHRKPVGSGARSRSHAFPRSIAGKTVGGIGTDNGGNAGSCREPGSGFSTGRPSPWGNPVIGFPHSPASFASRRGETGFRCPHLTGASSPAGGTLTSVSPTVQKRLSQVGGTPPFPPPTGPEPVLPVGESSQPLPPPASRRFLPMPRALAAHRTPIPFPASP